MRNILRAAGRTARGFLWIVKGLLLLLAVATLVLWPMSCGNALIANGFKYTVSPQRVDLVAATIGLMDGRIAARVEAGHYLRGVRLAMSQEQAARAGKGWNWRTGSIEYDKPQDGYYEKWGPLRWRIETTDDPKYAEESREIAAPCWLLAPLLALWPLTSLTLLIRRRTRLRRRIATGYCLHCGYDLRAAPSPGGGLLAVCPECGTENEKAKAEDR